jgi:tricorn protease-like protein
VTGWIDDDHYTEVRTDPADKQRRVYAISAADGTPKLHIDYSAIQKNLPSGFNAQSAAATTPDKKRFIFNHEGDLFFYDAEAVKFRR